MWTNTTRCRCRCDGASGSRLAVGAGHGWTPLRGAGGSGCAAVPRRNGGPALLRPSEGTCQRDASPRLSPAVQPLGHLLPMPRDKSPPGPLSRAAGPPAAPRLPPDTQASAEPLGGYGTGNSKAINSFILSTGLRAEVLEGPQVREACSEQSLGGYRGGGWGPLAAFD